MTTILEKPETTKDWLTLLRWLTVRSGTPADLAGLDGLLGALSERQEDDEQLANENRDEQSTEADEEE